MIQSANQKSSKCQNSTLEKIICDKGGNNHAVQNYRRHNAGGGGAF